MNDSGSTEILRLYINVTEFYSVKGGAQTVNLVLFRGRAESELFSGEILPGAVDTQTLTSDGGTTLSARYIIEGTDSGGNACRVFVENNTVAGSDFTSLVIVTDSPVLSRYESVPLRGRIGHENGILTVTVEAI